MIPPESCIKDTSVSNLWQCSGSYLAPWSQHSPWECWWPKPTQPGWCPDPQWRKALLLSLSGKAEHPGRRSHIWPDEHTEIQKLKAVCVISDWVFRHTGRDHWYSHLHVAPAQSSVEVLHCQLPPLGMSHKLRAALCGSKTTHNQYSMSTWITCTSSLSITTCLVRSPNCFSLLRVFINQN